MINKGWFILLVLALSVVVVCGSVVGASVKSPYAGKTLTLLFTAADPAKLLEKHDLEFEKATGAKIQWEMIRYDQVRAKAVLDAMGKTGAYDIIFVDSPWLSEFAELGYIRPLDELIKKTGFDLSGFMGSVLQSHSLRKGKMYTVPFSAGLWILAWRKDLFGMAGLPPDAPPATWNELLSYAEKLVLDVDGDGSIDTYGISTMAGQGDGTVMEWMHYLWAFGGDLVNESTWGLDFRNQAGLKALRFQRKLIDFAPPGATGATYYEHITQFTEGLTAMEGCFSLWGPHWEKPELYGSKIAGKVAYSLIPKRAVTYPLAFGEFGGWSSLLPEETPSMLCGWGAAIPIAAPNPELSFKYMEFMSSDEVMMDVAAWGLTGAKKAPYENAELLRKFPHQKVALEAMRVARPRLPMVEYTPVKDIMAEELSAYYIGQKSAEETLDSAYQRVFALMREAGYYK